MTGKFDESRDASASLFQILNPEPIFIRQVELCFLFFGSKKKLSRGVKIGSVGLSETHIFFFRPNQNLD